MNLKQILINEARHLGFSLAGFTTPAPPPHLPAFQNWLALGRHAEMKYMADPRRFDPCRLLPECRSILVLTARYLDPLSVTEKQAPDTASSGKVAQGRIAAYAWGRDYHLILSERLKGLVVFLEQLTGSPIAQRGYTDSGPLLERDLAQRAGLGWIGKNTCLIHPGIGSYFFLAELLLGLEFEPDDPFTADRCGTCTRCLDACPTGALLPDRMMDARRCISYLTIENIGPIPQDLRSRMGNWIFGCDICQMVCPWNHHPVLETDPVFSFSPDIPAPDLYAELALTPDEFNNKFKDNPIQRSRRRGYLRNVAVALGNVGGKNAIPALESAINNNEDALVREHAIWALEHIKHQ